MLKFICFPIQSNTFQELNYKYQLGLLYINLILLFLVYKAYLQSVTLHYEGYKSWATGIKHALRCVRNIIPGTTKVQFTARNVCIGLRTNYYTFMMANGSKYYHIDLLISNIEIN